MQNTSVGLNAWAGIANFLLVYLKSLPNVLLPLLASEIDHKSVTCDQTKASHILLTSNMWLCMTVTGIPIQTKVSDIIL